MSLGRLFRLANSAVLEFYQATATAGSSVKTSRASATEPRMAAAATITENTDNPQRLYEILSGLAMLGRDMPVVLPLHPRTRLLTHQHRLQALLDGLLVVDPLSFLDMVALEQSAAVIITDSGGVQKEAYFYGVPCVTTRDETEWVETVLSGRNCFVGASAEKLTSAVQQCMQNGRTAPTEFPYGRGDASEKILSKIVSSFATVLVSI